MEPMSVEAIVERAMSDPGRVVRREKSQQSKELTRRRQELEHQRDLAERLELCGLNTD